MRRDASWLAAGFALTLAGLLGCGAEPEPTPPSPPDPNDFECSEAADDWRRCTPEGDLEYCHALYEPIPHFHLIRNCEDFGFECVTAAPGVSSCARFDEVCVDGAARCQDNLADNCVAGRWFIDRCGRGHCEVQDGKAVCVFEP